MINAKNNPYRAGSYSQVYNILFQHRQNGISRMALLKKVMRVSKKPEKYCKYNIAIVSSPRKDGSAHRSARTASDIYFVEKQNDWLKLHLRDTTEQDFKEFNEG